MPSTKFAAKPKLNSLTFQAIGTHWSIDMFQSVANLSKLRRAVLGRIEQFDKNYSRFREDSLVSRMANEAGTHELPLDAQKMLDMYAELYGHTSGAMSPLVGNTLSDAGYDANYSLKYLRKTAAKPFSDVVNYNSRTITLSEPVVLDFGAMGKGYLVDIVCDLLSNYGLTEFCVNAGGDIYHKSGRGSRLSIGLEHPGDHSLAIGVAQICNQAICGSSGNLRSWGEYHHIMDARTAVSPKHIAALWVVASSAMLADALSTALFFVTPKQLQEHYTFEYAILDNNYNLTYSASFPAEFFAEEPNAAKA